MSKYTYKGHLILEEEHLKMYELLKEMQAAYLINEPFVNFRARVLQLLKEIEG